MDGWTDDICSQDLIQGSLRNIPWIDDVSASLLRKPKRQEDLASELFQSREKGVGFSGLAPASLIWELLTRHYPPSDPPTSQTRLYCGQTVGFQ